MTFFTSQVCPPYISEKLAALAIALDHALRVVAEGAQYITCSAVASVWF